MIDKLRRLLGLEHQDARIRQVEKRLDRIEDQMVRSSELDLVKNEIQELKDKKSLSEISKGDKARRTILKLLDQELEKGEIKKRILELEICSESHFYRVWNDLEKAGYIVNDELQVEIHVDQS